MVSHISSDISYSDGKESENYLLSVLKNAKICLHHLLNWFQQSAIGPVNILVCSAIT